jgi:putative ABC transport system substrate-binding protein
MTKKALVSLLAIFFLATVPSAQAQQPGKVHRIGLLIAASNVIAPFTDAFRHGMRELGYVEGKNYILEIRSGGAEPNQLSFWRLSWSVLRSTSLSQ